MIATATARTKQLRKQVKAVLKSSSCMTAGIAQLKRLNAKVVAAAKHLKRAGLSEDMFIMAELRYADAIEELDHQYDLVTVAVGAAVVVVAREDFTQRELVLQGMTQGLALERAQWESHLRQEQARAVVRSGSSGVVVRETRGLRAGGQHPLSLTANDAVQSAAFMLDQQDEEKEMSESD